MEGLCFSLSGRDGKTESLRGGFGSSGGEWGRNNGSIWSISFRWVGMKNWKVLSALWQDANHFGIIHIKGLVFGDDFFQFRFDARGVLF